MMPVTKTTDSLTLRNILIGLGGGLVLWAGISFIYNQVSATDFKKLNEANWKAESVGSPYIAFESPVQLANTSRPNNEREREFIQYQMQYTYKEGRDLIIVATVINYHLHVYLDPMAAEQSVKGLEQLYRATDITFESKPVTINNYPAKRIDGRFKIGDRPYRFARVNLEARNLVRDLLVIVKDEDPEAARFLERMASSVGVE